MALPIAGILIGAVTQVIKSKLSPKSESVSVGDAVVGHAVTSLIKSSGQVKASLIAGQKLALCLLALCLSSCSSGGCKLLLNSSAAL